MIKLHYEESIVHLTNELVLFFFQPSALTSLAKLNLVGSLVTRKRARNKKLAEATICGDHNIEALSVGADLSARSNPPFSIGHCDWNQF